MDREIDHTRNRNISHFEDIFAGGDDEADAARIVKMAEWMSDRRSMYGPRIHTALKVIPGGPVNTNLAQTSPIAQSLPAEPKRRSRVLSALIPSFTFRSNSRQTHTESQEGHPIESQLDYRQRQSLIPSPQLTHSLPPPTPSFQQPHSSNRSHSHRAQFKCSASTLLRAAKAKQYLELFIEYIDLLDTLPPAKEMPNLSHNQPQQQLPYHLHSHSPIHGSSPSQLLSRNYNPLQTIRNRRLRNRQGFGQLDLTPWEDPIAVHSWVESTITASQDAKFHDHSKLNNSSLIYPPSLHLPPPPHPHPMEKHKNKPKRSKLDWVVHPSELFADFYWMNKGGVTIVEDSLGEKMFKRGSSPTTGSNVSATSSASVRGSLDRVRGSGRGIPLNQARITESLGKWASGYGDYSPNNHFSNGVKAREGSDTLATDAGATKAIHDNDVAERLKAPDQLCGPSLQVGPGITIGIGGGCISHDDSVDEEESEGEKGRASLESRRYSLQLEDESVPRDIPIPLRRGLFEGSDRMRTDKHASKKRHHNFYRFGHRQVSHEDEGHLSDSSLESLGAASSDSEASGSKKKDSKFVTKKKGYHIWSGLNTSADLYKSHEDLTAECETFDIPEKHLKPTAFIRRLKQKTRRHPTNKNETIDDSDEDTNYESATASRSPSPAIIPHQDLPSRSSVDKGKRVMELPPRSNFLPPSIRDMGCIDTSRHKASSSAGTLSIDGLKERGRERNGLRDDGLGTFFKRTISPTKREDAVQKSNKYPGEERTLIEKHIVSRQSKDFERDALALLDKDRDKDKRNRAINTVKKAKEKVGNRVERIKHGVGGFMRGKEAPLSVPSSNYASSLGSGGGTSDREEYSEDDKLKKSWVSRDLEGISRSQTRRPIHRHLKQPSGVNLLHFDLDTGTATPSDASVDGDGEDFWQKRGIHNMVEDPTGMETPLKTKVTGPLRDHWSLRNVGSYEEFRPGGTKPNRERSRLAEEIRDDIGPSVLPDLASLGRLRLPPIAALPRSSPATGAPTKQAYPGKRDLVRARALMLSTGMLARGMASRTQTLQQKSSTAAPPEFVGTLQRTVYHHAISARHLSRQIHSANQDLEKRIITFRNVTISHLRNKILCTQDEISKKLTPLVQTTADEADVLSGELSTHYVFEVKRLHDEVSTLVRKRRRTTLKWVRRGGYVLLEWVVLAVMWWVWLIVVMVRIARVILGGVGRGIKWMILWK